jgi:uncharacterized protein (TIGR03118 family)
MCDSEDECLSSWTDHKSNPQNGETAMSLHRYRNETKLLAPALGVLALLLASQTLSAQSNTFHETDLVSDIPGRAALTDPDLANPWGITHSASSPLWIADNHTGRSTIYNGAGQKLGLTVTVPPSASGESMGSPTGLVVNGSAGFGGSHFIFATEDGTISGWASGTSAVLKADNNGGGAVYKGLALGNNGSGDFLYAANFHAGTVDVFDSSFTAASLAGAFTDASIPAGFAPFNVQNLDGHLYVTYAKQDATGHDDVRGAGNGYIDKFDLNGNLEQRIASNGPLNSPWGLALAPADFGPFGGDLLVGNFGDGTINAFDATTGDFLDVLKDADSNPLAIAGLWGLSFGNGASGGDLNKLYFTAGIPGDGAVEDHGLFGSISHVPDGGMSLFLVAGAMFALLGVRRRLHLAEGDGAGV